MPVVPGMRERPGVLAYFAGKMRGREGAK
jgi:hypothetical protein